DEYEPVPGLVADVEPVARGGRAARLSAGIQRGYDRVGRGVDDRDRSRSLVRDVGEGRGERERGQEKRERQEIFHEGSMRRNTPYRGKKRCLSAAATWTAISATKMYEVVTCTALKTA